MSGPCIKDKNGKIARKDKEFDGRSELLLPDPRNKHTFLRTNKATYRLMLTLVGPNPARTGEDPTKEKPERPKPYPNRCDMFQDAILVLDLIHTVAFELGSKDHHDLLDEALSVIRQLEEVAAKLNYRDRHDVLADAIASLMFLSKKSALPAFAKIEDTPLIAQTAKADQPNML